MNEVQHALVDVRAFESTDPLVWRHLANRWTRVRHPELPATRGLLRFA